VWAAAAECCRSNAAILAETRYRLAASRRCLNRAFGVSGATDVDASSDQAPWLREKARQAIERKRMPNREPIRLGGVAGVGHLCAVCERAVTTGETDLELFFTRDGKRAPTVYHVHARCYAAWARTIQDGSDGVSARNG